MAGNFKRSDFIQKGSLKISDKGSDAVAYILDATKRDGSPVFYLTAFSGKRGRPIYITASAI